MRFKNTKYEIELIDYSCNIAGIVDGIFGFDENKNLIVECAPIDSRADRVKIYFLKKYATRKGIKKSFFDYCMTLKNKRVYSI